jgi:hypothetical protein
MEDNEMGGLCSNMKGELHTGFCWKNFRERDHLEDLGVYRRIILNLIYREWDGAWTKFVWLRAGPGGWLL